MLISIALLWLIFSFLDIVISSLVIRLGGQEVMPLYRWLGEDWEMFVFVKGVFTILVAILLVSKGKKSILTGLTVGMAVICAWNGLVLASLV